MARSKSAAPATASLPADAATQLETDAALHGQLVTQREQMLATFDQRFGLDLPYERNTIIAIARENVVAAAERMLVIGRACMLLKANEPHGEFGAALQEIGIGERFARRAMQCAVKFEGGEGRKLLAARLSASKLLELVTEEDADLDALGDGGELAGLTLDEVDRMTKAELREALRRERKEAAEELAAREEIIGRKDEKIRKLDAKARGVKRQPINERAFALLAELDASVVGLLEKGDETKALIDSVMDLYAEAGEEMPADIETRVRQAADSAAGLVAGIEQLTGA
jgi:hypothetical protein